MADLLGPANAPFSVTVRPAETRIFGALDTYFRDCSSTLADDGTDIQAAWLNAVLQQLRVAIRGAGVAENNGNDAMLLEAIQLLSRGRVQVYATPGTYSWVAPSTVTRVRVRLWGAGGGGGGSATAANSVASSAGGGGYSEGTFAITAGATYPVIVGAGGVPGAGGASPQGGGTGGTSSFGSLISATGGTGGVPANGAVQSATGAQGSGSGGQVNVSGVGGGTGFVVGSAFLLAQGGAAFQSNYTPTVLSGSANPGPNGIFPGGGASGGILGAAGGTGANGLVIIDY